MAVCDTHDTPARSRLDQGNRPDRLYRSRGRAGLAVSCLLVGWSAGCRASEPAPGRARLEQGAVDDSDRALRAAVVAGADYLERAVDRHGAFAYAYRARTDEVEDSYNMVRHAGTVFALLQAWQAMGEPRWRAAEERAIGYLLAHVEPYGPADERMSVMAYGGKIKLGGVALTALALATHAQTTGDKTHLDTAQRLCRYLVHEQRPDGSFAHQRAHPSGELLDFVSEYYPGEALLALMTVHRLDGDPRWLDAATAGARYLIEVRDQGVATLELTHDHWLLYALEQLYAARPDARYLEHAARIAQAIVAAQYRGRRRDRLGAYTRPARSAPIATRNEGLLAAYRLARGAGRAEDAAAILGAVELGNRALVAMQIDERRARALAHPARALGGVTRGYDSDEVRIDYVQHALSSWLALLAARGDPG